MRAKLAIALSENDREGVKVALQGFAPKAKLRLVQTHFGVAERYRVIPLCPADCCPPLSHLRFVSRRMTLLGEVAAELGDSLQASAKAKEYLAAVASGQVPEESETAEADEASEESGEEKQ